MDPCVIVCQRRSSSQEVGLWRQLSDQLTVVLAPGVEPGEERWEQFAARGISVVEGPVGELVVVEDRLRGLRLADGHVVDCDALAVSTTLHARVGFLAPLGLRPVPFALGETVVGSRLETGPTGTTAVPGLYAAGNATDLFTQVAGSVSGGSLTAAAVNASLIAEDTAAAVAARAAAGPSSPSSAGSGPRAPQPRTPQPRTPQPRTTAPNDETIRGHVDENMEDAGQFWEELYAGREARPLAGGPNVVLADVVTTLGGELPAGNALDLGCAEGADSSWLAGRGWRVLGVDVSATALERTRARAEHAGVGDRVHTERHDLGESFPVGRFGLVSAHYLHTPLDFPRAHVLQQAAAAVAPGGLLLIVDHASVAPWSWHQQDVVFPAPRETLATLALDPADWSEHRVEATERRATGPDGQVATVTDNVLAMRRRPEC